MPIQFQTTEQIFYFVLGVRYARHVTPLTAEQVPGFGTIMREILMTREQESMTIGQVLSCLPDDMRLGQVRCTDIELIPLLLLIMEEGSRLPDYLRFTLVEESGQVTTVSVSSPQAAHTVDPLPPRSAWERVLSLPGLPVKTNEVFHWLKAISPPPIDSWVAGVESLETVHRKYAADGESPLRYLQRLVPDWDGSPEISISGIQDLHPGIPALLSKHLIPGFAELLKRNTPSGSTG